MKCKVKYFNAERGFGFIEALVDYYFSTKGYTARVWGHSGYKFELAECPDIGVGTEVEILGTAINTKGPIAVSWTVPALHVQEELFAVLRYSETTGEYVASQERKCFVATKLVEQCVVFVGNLNDCKATIVPGDTVLLLGMRA
jgi:hypothetical protein